MCATSSLDQKLAVNPIKISPQTGAILAFLGIHKTVPILHGAQGCASYAKTMLTRHFREPIPLQTTALRQEQVVMGSEAALSAALETVIHKQHPDLIGVISTSLTETSGEDLDSQVKNFRSRHPEAPPVVVAHVTDYSGSLTNGYVMALDALVDELETWQYRQTNKSARGNLSAGLLFGPTYTPGDIEEVKELFSEFSIDTIVFPDLSLSMDGHLGKAIFGATDGGVSVEALAHLRDTDYIFTFGKSVARIGERIAKWADNRHFSLAVMSSLTVIDELVDLLSNMTMRKVSQKLLRDRDRLMDRMIDVHSYLDGKRAAIAGEPDLIASLHHGLTMMGVDVIAEWSPVSPASCGYDDTWSIGGFYDMEQFLAKMPAGQQPHLLLTNSHGKQIAHRLRTEFLSVGLPVWDRVGVPNESSVSYRGVNRWITQIANLLISRDFEQ